MPTITITVPTGTEVKTVETPDGKPPVDNAAALKTMTDNRDAWKAYGQDLAAKWKAEADKDAADAVGKDALAVPQPPVV